ncbi:6-phosphogluconolactonase [Streptococcus sp. DD10]|uniref:lactonase family protein n=1 Tax=Streptococcus sp. DD10 TaxID=1777878 RepID=UPI00079183EF|nr:lactonase family protein [Streptococcus sp. DD10]KXT74112.1 6-phosphogluconolactonase [Streptococcus sp. DD10]
MTQKVFFGTYTKRESKGIYQADFDSSTGILSNLQLASSMLNPTYLSFSESGFLYSVAARENKGGVASYSPDLTLLNSSLEEGAPPCYVSVDDQRRLVFATNYHKGEVTVYNIQNDGSLSLVDKVVQKGSGPHENQASSHVHFADLTPDRFLVTCDLGADKVTTYEISTEGKLSVIDVYETIPGAGPRHIVFHNHLKTAYLINELNSTVEVLFYDGAGQFEHFQTISTVPDDYTGQKWASAIRLSSDGRFLYTSERAHNSIAIFAVLADGSLELLDIVASKGLVPRDFAISPDDNFLIVAHQESDQVTVFKRDQNSGLLNLLSHDFYVPEGVSVLFK